MERKHYIRAEAVCCLVFDLDRDYKLTGAILTSWVLPHPPQLLPRASLPLLLAPTYQNLLLLLSPPPPSPSSLAYLSLFPSYPFAWVEACALVLGHPLQKYIKKLDNILCYQTTNMYRSRNTPFSFRVVALIVQVISERDVFIAAQALFLLCITEHKTTNHFKQNSPFTMQGQVTAVEVSVPLTQWLKTVVVGVVLKRGVFIVRDRLHSIVTVLFLFTESGKHNC